MFMVLENYRDFEKDDFPRDKNGLNIRCDNCAGISEQYLIIEGSAFCKGCLGLGIKILNKSFMKHCNDSWDKRVKEEKNGRI